jgi:cyanophycinase-like exopeptidase
MKTILSIALFCFGCKVQAQNTVYTTGNINDTITHSRSATLLMGGATENDSVMKKFLQYADGGDVVVLRASGADGYNNYFFTDLGVKIHSVQTFVVNTIAGANDSTLVQAVRNAEAVWIAGGNQYNYIQYWRGTALNNALNYAINTKRIPQGGTSAGMAIQGQYYNSAQNGSVTSAAALANPYDPTVTVDVKPFINNANLKNLITDTHFDNPDRRGRLMTFLARVWQDSNQQISAIACDEYTAVWIDSNNIGYVYGSDPSDHAYFITIDCEGNNTIENCTNGSPLNWNQDGKVVKVYDIVGNNQGSGYYNLNNFKKIISQNSGGVWLDWSVNNGTLISSPANPLNCATSVDDQHFSASVSVLPNPVGAFITIASNDHQIVKCIITNMFGKVVYDAQVNNLQRINTTDFARGVYFVTIQSSGGNTTQKIIFQ